MPATEVEFHDGYEALDRVVDIGDREEHFRVAHEAIFGISKFLYPRTGSRGFTIRDNVLGDPF